MGEEGNFSKEKAIAWLNRFKVSGENVIEELLTAEPQNV